MTTHTTFATLAANAEAVGCEMSVKYRVEYLNGKIWEPVGDEHADFDAAYDDYVESHKNFTHADLICWEISPDGMATDITDRMIYEAEMICEQRGLSKEWLQ